MGSLFTPKVPEPAKPKPVRMPVQNDPELQAAAQRNRESMMRRSGRQSTILSDATRGATKLGG